MFSPHLRRQSRRSVRLEPSYRRATPPRASIRSRLTAPAVRVGSERRGYVLILEGSSERSLAEKTKSDDMTPVRRADITWNFEKFLVNQHGRPVKRYSPKFENADIAADIDALLMDPEAI